MDWEALMDELWSLKAHPTPSPTCPPSPTDQSKSSLSLKCRILAIKMRRKNRGPQLPPKLISGNPRVIHAFPDPEPN